MNHGAERSSASVDEELVIRVREGDTEAYADLVRRYQDKIYALICGFIGPAEEALDLTQDIFVKAYRELGRFRGRSSFYTWLHRIAVNTCIDHGRKAKVEYAASLDHLPQNSFSPNEDPEQALEEKELQEAVQRAVTRLSPKLRAVMVLHDIEGLTMREIADVVGCGLATVKTRLFRARAEVRDQVRGKEGW